MVKEITSSQNRIYKLCVSLATKKHRDKEGKYIIEGINLLEEAVKNSEKIFLVIVRDDFDTSKVPNFQCDTYIMDNKLYSKIAQTETSQGILAVVEKPVYDLKDIGKAIGKDGNVVVLDRLQDAGNIGTIIRTADAAGYSAVVVLKGTADIFSPKVIRAATGSVFRIPIVFADDNRELIKIINEWGLDLVVTSLKTDKYYYDVDLTHGVAVVIGNEGNGVSDELIELAPIKIKIPMEGNIESLNASIAAAILMYERLRINKIK